MPHLHQVMDTFFREIFVMKALLRICLCLGYYLMKQNKPKKT